MLPALLAILFTDAFGEFTFGAQLVFGERVGEGWIELVGEATPGTFDSLGELADVVLETGLDRHARPPPRAREGRQVTTGVNGTGHS